jgi:hypothetical protein
MEKLELLHEKITQRYKDYNSKMLAADRCVLFDSAWEIAAMSDAHYYMTETHEYTDEEIDFFLKLDDPLWKVADMWQRCQSEISDLEYTIDEVFRDGVVL